MAYGRGGLYRAPRDAMSRAKNDTQPMGLPLALTDPNKGLDASPPATTIIEAQSARVHDTLRMQTRPAGAEGEPTAAASDVGEPARPPMPYEPSTSDPALNDLLRRIKPGRAPAAVSASTTDGELSAKYHADAHPLVVRNPTPLPQPNVMLEVTADLPVTAVVRAPIREEEGVVSSPAPSSTTARTESTERSARSSPVLFWLVAGTTAVALFVAVFGVVSRYERVGRQAAAVQPSANVTPATPPAAAAPSVTALPRPTAPVVSAAAIPAPSAAPAVSSVRPFPHPSPPRPLSPPVRTASPTPPEDHLPPSQDFTQAPL